MAAGAGGGLLEWDDGHGGYATNIVVRAEFGSVRFDPAVYCDSDEHNEYDSDVSGEWGRGRDICNRHDLDEWTVYAACDDSYGNDYGFGGGVGCGEPDFVDCGVNSESDSSGDVGAGDRDGSECDELFTGHSG
jgi:hypothetical protein